MGNFNKGKSGGKRFGGGGRSFGGDRGGSKGFGGGRGGDRPTMHKAVCSDCGNSCEVPFRPTGDKPIFCSDCFKNKRGGSQDRGISRDRYSKPRFDNKRSFQSGGGKDTPNYNKQFEMLNNKLDKILKMLNPDITDEIEKPKSKKYEMVKKEVNITSLKKALDKTKEKKPVVKKKVVAKKTPAKKVVAKKKTATKKKKKN